MKIQLLAFIFCKMVKAGLPIKANISPSSTKPIKHYYRPSSGKQLWRISDFVQKELTLSLNGTYRELFKSREPFVSFRFLFNSTIYIIDRSWKSAAFIVHIHNIQQSSYWELKPRFNFDIGIGIEFFFLQNRNFFFQKNSNFSHASHSRRDIDF